MNLKKLTFVFSVIGILLLLFLTTTIPPKEINIRDINNHFLNKQIQTTGQIINIHTYNLTSKNILQVIKISEPLNSSEKIDIVLNTPKLNLEKNQTLTITGKITQYKGSLQIQADKIRDFP